MCAYVNDMGCASSMLSSASLAAGSARCSQRQLKSSVCEKLGVAAHRFIIPALRSLRQEDGHEYKISLDYIESLCHQRSNKKPPSIGTVGTTGAVGNSSRGNRGSSRSAPAPWLTVSNTQLISEWKCCFKKFLWAIWGHILSRASVFTPNLIKN